MHVHNYVCMHVCVCVMSIEAMIRNLHKSLLCISCQYGSCDINRLRTRFGSPIWNRIRTRFGSPIWNRIRTRFGSPIWQL